MASPFTPLKSFTDDATPSIDAGFLNDLQAGLSAVAFPAYSRVQYKARCLDAAACIFYAQPFFVKDTATSQYVGIDAATATIQAADCTNSAWNWIYLKSTNGIVSAEVSTTPPESSLREMTDDPTRRYLCAVYINGSGEMRRFHAKDGVYRFDETVVALNTASHTANAWNSVTMSGIKSLPSSASSYTLRCEIQNADTSNVHRCWFRSVSANGAGNTTANGSANFLFAPQSLSLLTTFNSGYFTFDESANFEYYPSHATLLGIYVTVDGMVE